MVDLAEHRRPVASRSKEIAARQGISEKYLENILGYARARQHALGHARQGRRLRAYAPPEQYTVGEILRLTEGSLAPVACLDGDCKGCSRSDECPTLDVWKNLDKLINDYLDGVTLDQLVAPNHGYDYVI